MVRRSALTLPVVVVLALLVVCTTSIDFSAMTKAATTVSALSTSSSSTQFHLSLVGTSKTNAKVVDYTIDWITSADTTSSQLVYGTSANAMTTQVDAQLSGLVEETKGESVACWSAVIRDVSPGTTIYYALSDAAAGSSPNSFTVPKADFTWAVFGDLGAPMQKKASGVSLPALKNALEKDSAYHGVLNIGDLGYELVGANGKNFMDELESITSKVPMQTTVGNVSAHVVLHAPLITPELSQFTESPFSLVFFVARVSIWCRSRFRGAELLPTVCRTHPWSGYCQWLLLERVLQFLLGNDPFRSD